MSIHVEPIHNKSSNTSLERRKNALSIQKLKKKVNCLKKPRLQKELKVRSKNNVFFLRDQFTQTALINTYNSISFSDLLNVTYQTF